MHEEHIHEHTHADGTTHSHPHSHEHGSQHDHTHAPSDSAEIKALLSFTLQHNKHHNEELDDMKKTLISQGFGDAADMISQAIVEYDRGNELLKKASELIH